MRNDEGLAYGAMMVFLYFFAAVMIWLSWTYAYDIFLGSVINPSIAAGDVSVQTAHAVEWNVNVMRYAPPIFLLFGFVFAINYALYKAGGSGATFSTFWYGFVAFIICCVCGLILSYFGGGLIDYLHEESVNWPGQDSNFATQSEGQIYWYINIFYLVCYCIPILGAVIFGQSIVKRVRNSAYTYR